MLLGLTLASCAVRSDKTQAADARRFAASVFPVPLEELAKRPGVDVRDLPGGTQGCPEHCPTTYVKVSPSAARGELSFGALMTRLQDGGWGLISGIDSADACTTGKQTLPCHFTKGESGSIVVTPGDDGSYEVSASRE